MAGSSENKSEDVEMADAAPPAAEEAPKKKAAAAGKAPRFEIKKWNAVVSIHLSLLSLYFDAVLLRYFSSASMIFYACESCIGGGSIIMDTSTLMAASDIYKSAPM